MRTISYAALALAAGLALSGAAQADEYISAANRAQYAVSAQGALPGAAAFSEALLPAAAQPTARTVVAHAPAPPPAPVASPFAAENPHWGPAPDGSLPMR